MFTEDQTALQEWSDYCNETHSAKGFNECFAGCVFGEGMVWTSEAIGNIF